MIPGQHRLKGGAVLLGARGPGDAGPFGRWPVTEARDDDQEHEEQPDSAGHDA